MTSLKSGDYVLATKYADGDPTDHWCVGFYDGNHPIHESRHMVVDSNKEQFSANGFGRCERIPQKAGVFLCLMREAIEMQGVSVWQWKEDAIAFTNEKATYRSITRWLHLIPAHSRQTHKNHIIARSSGED